jgi:hypothetical protein
LIPLTAADLSCVLEHGIQVTLSKAGNGTAHTGDYWCFAARTADADIERLDQAPPLGIHHHFCKLAIIEPDGTIDDCRPQFPALTELTSLFYVSGDGQETLPGQVLPKPIQVGVANGKRPVAGASVRFHVSGGNGSLSAGTSSGNDLNVLTDSLGVASCVWTLDGANQSQQVEAMLADGSHLPVRFNASLTQPGGAEPGIHVQKISVGGDTLGNDTEVTVAELASGITISCDANPFHGSVFNKPVCFVTLEMPFPFNDVDIQLWGPAIVGFQPLILAATVNSELESIFWQVTEKTKEWLETLLFKVMVAQKRETKRLLARLTLKGNFIWSEKNPNLYLDGEVFGTPTSGGAITVIKLPSGDNRRGGDLEMWFWLIDRRATDEVTITIKPSVATVVLGRRVEFAVAVEGTTNKSVQMALVPPTGGTIVPSTDKPDTWIYTPPATTLLNQVNVIAKSNADPTKTATAVVNIVRGQQDIVVTIAPLQTTLAPGDQIDFTVGVQNGNVTKVDMRVNNVPNGNLQVGTIAPAPQKGPGVWTYTAPRAVPTANVMNIVATSQEDTTKSATAQVTITRVNPQLGPEGSTNPTAREKEPNSGGSESSSSPRRRPRRPRT